MIHSKPTRSLLFLLFGILFIVSVVVLEYFSSRSNTPAGIKTEFLKILHDKEKKTAALLTQLASLPASAPDSISPDIDERLKRIHETEGISLFKFIDDSLIYWSSNAVPFTIRLLPLPDESPVIKKLSNGWYEIISKKEPSGLFVGLILIQNQYPYENDFLKNDFQSQFHFPEGTQILKPLNIAGPEAGFDKKELVISVPQNQGLSEYPAFASLSLFILGFLCIVISIYLFYKQLTLVSVNRWWLFTGFILDVILLRLLTIWIRKPSLLYETPLFSPSVYSSSILLPSLGDFLINSILLLTVAFAFFRFISEKPLHQKVGSRKKLLLIITLLLFLPVALLFDLFISGELVLNSSIPMTLSDLSTINFYSVIAALILILCNLALLLVIFGLNRWSLSVRNLGITFVILSIAGTLFLNHFNAIRESRKRELLALRLSQNRDPVAELLYSRMEDEMRSDPVLTAPHNNDDSISSYIRKHYFGETWNNYIIQVTVCHPGKTLRIQPREEIADCHLYFGDLLNDFGKQIAGSSLYFLDFGYGFRNYMAVVRLGPHDRSDSLSSVAYVEINTKLLFRDLGYPELLIDKSRSTIPDAGGYSYAFYRSGKLVHSFGNIAYGLDLSEQFAGDETIRKSGNLIHHLYPIDHNNLLVISRHSQHLFDRVAPFSYLFFLFSIVSVLFFLIVRFPRVLMFSRAGFRERMQLAMSGILLASLFTIGVLSTYYITRLNYEKNLENLSERTHSVLVELQHQLGSRSGLEAEDPSLLNELMTRYSNVFFSDVNLYSPGGMLLATSRPEVFENGLISPLMNRSAYSGLSFGHSSGLVQEEMIGYHKYSSAYLPFFNDRNTLLAFINLPYFARQDDLRKEIATFMTAFINIYVLLVIAGFFTSIFVSNYITRPLRLLTERLGRLTLGDTNEKLFWQRNDEVGRLVAEYNRKVDELARSAEILARSERETAWKEMARQVAHEIKNPLTPMKLSVQHLLRSWEEGSGDWDQRLRRFSATMVEQIDSLSFIASEFSDFARMPAPVNEVLDLNELLTSVISFYSGLDRITLNYSGSNVPALIHADKKQIMRLFSNLLNNSVQAIGERNRGNITLRLTTQGLEHNITVSDDGHGISPEQSEKIFQPNFTTKSGGMGLGLAIVRSIVLSTGGSIAFSSEQGKETVFTITFPVFRSDVTH